MGDASVMIENLPGFVNGWANMVEDFDMERMGRDPMEEEMDRDLMKDDMGRDPMDEDMGGDQMEEEMKANEVAEHPLKLLTQTDVVVAEIKALIGEQPN